MDGHSAEPEKLPEFSELDSLPAQTRKVWETPVLEELSVHLSALTPNTGGDGSVYADCTRT